MSPKYFPYLRGKQSELIALRTIADRIAKSGRIKPIIEPVNFNPSTQTSLRRFIEAAMSFLFICNPTHKTRQQDDLDEISRILINEILSDYDNWTPAFYVDENTSLRDFSRFLDEFDDIEQRALVYSGMPRLESVLNRIDANEFTWHVFIGTRFPRTYVERIPRNYRVYVDDRFVRTRNADYPAREFFSDRNTLEGNPRKLNFGDFSVVGDHFQTGGGAAYAITLHHMHYAADSMELHLSHFISDRTQSTVDTPGKALEALHKLVNTLRRLRPNDTDACREYREMYRDERWGNQMTLKRLAIQHHLEIMIGDGLRELY